jgi:formate hydrogenlyase subunit 3/multisubunit Na+/H+ antiporter MnhD subunit
MAESAQGRTYDQKKGRKLSNGATIFSLVKPFLPWAGFFIGIGLLVEGLGTEFLPTCLAGYSAPGVPIYVRCDSLYAILLIVTGTVLAAFSIFIWRSTYSRRKNTTNGSTQLNHPQDEAEPNHR